MEEILKKLLESEVFTDETRQELTDAFNAKLTEAVEAAKAETEAKVKAELTEKYVTDFDALVEAVDTKTEEYLKTELQELKEDIRNFRDLEAEFAERLVEERAKMAEVIKSDMSELIDNLDSFLKEALQEEFAELKNDIKQVKELEFGKTIFESVAKEYQRKFVNEDETFNTLKETQAKLEEAEKALKESTLALEKSKRETKLMEVLEPLQGRAKEVMEAILAKVPTDKLEEAYGKFIGHVLHESVEEKNLEKENSGDGSVLAESNKDDTSSTDNNVVVKGNSEDKKHLLESMERSEPKAYQPELDRLKYLAGIDA